MSTALDLHNPALEVRNLTCRFGGLVATQDVSLAIAPGARHALIGPNGAGKTTFVNLLTGVLQPSSGSIWLEGQPVTRLARHVRVARGLVRTFQINQLFPSLTARETLVLAACQTGGSGGTIWRAAARRSAAQARAAELITTFGLDSDADRPVRVLPYGKQRLLEIALALACNPRVLLLDEPAAGVPEHERHAILHALALLPEDMTILLIEHDMDLVFAFASRITVLVNGAVFADGTPAGIAADPRVRAVYLGEVADG